MNAASLVDAELSRFDTLNRERALTEGEARRVEYLLRRETHHRRLAAKRARDARHSSPKEAAHG